MRRCAFLTMTDPTGYVIDDDLAIDPLAALGWEVSLVPWDQPDVDWDAFEVVVIRSPWDYQHRPEAFLSVLAEIDASRAVLENPLEVVRWNLDKTYLRDLEARGVAVVPTHWGSDMQAGGFQALFQHTNADELVVKPTVGAGAVGAFRADRTAAASVGPRAEAYYAARPFMAQPFVPSVLDEGEYSLFYFDGVLSHAILKTPKAMDFRVQEEHGGIIRRVAPEPALVQAGERVLRALGRTLLYARVDLVRANGGDGYWLMEVELVEPALYFRFAPESTALFAQALNARIG